MAQVVQAPLPVAPLPAPRQLAWQQREFIVFVHFGVNTFSDREWGDGTEAESSFNPTALDCQQWAAAFKAAGAKLVILTAKHHDGFCLWPSAYTQHSVKSSPFRQGQGDVVKELSSACAAAGLEFGVYLSPWDRNNPAYGSGEGYNQYYLHQLTELLTHYGPIKEVWFDGACGEGPNGKRQVYDFGAFWDKVRELAPEACMFSDVGPDVRWVGNESGYSADTNWSTFDAAGRLPGEPNRKQTSGYEGGRDWLPAETDVSIRPGWFYHASEDDRVKSLDHLLDIYYHSVGLNSVLLLNVPPDRRGLIHEHDVRRLREFREVLDATFAHDLAHGKPVTASTSRGGAPAFGPGNLTDGEFGTYWATDDGVTTASFVVDLGQPTTFNVVDLGEFIPLGQRVQQFHVEAQIGGAWQPLAQGHTIGYKRLLRLAPTTATQLRVTIDAARACPCLNRFGLYLEPPKVQVAPAERAFAAGRGVDLTLTADVPGATVRYTLDGTEPTPQSPTAAGPVHLDHSATVTARAWFGGQRSPHAAVASFEALVPREPVAGAGEPGLRYTYYEGGWQTLDQLAGAKAVATGTVPAFDLGVRQRDEHCALVFEGYVRVPQDGAYRLILHSDDGSRLWIGDRLVVDHDGLHGSDEEKSGLAVLKAGRHPVKVAWFNATGGRALTVEYEGPGVTRQAIGAEALTR